MQAAKAKRDIAADASKAPSGISVGLMPNSADSVTVKSGVVYVGKYPAQNYDSGADVTVPDGATNEQIRDALKSSGALGKNLKVFGLSKAAPVAVEAASSGNATGVGDAKPKGLKQIAAQRIAQRADYFTPGNVVKSYGGHDEVVSYTPPDETGSNWSVKVRAVVQKDGQWVPDPKDNRERLHSTPPGTKELDQGPVLRAKPAAVQKPELNQPPAQQTSAPDAIEKVALENAQDPVAQRAEAARADEVRKKRASRLRGYTDAKSPFLSFLGKFGVSLKQRPDLSPD
ncbi:MAG: hypothetical protein H7293_07160, partial [Candidatus Saccharibacteria bacterium]|nr:hypothetical protein [Rhodoferax sp.]